MSMGSAALNGTEVMYSGRVQVLPDWLMQCARTTAGRRVNAVPSRHITYRHAGSSMQQCMLEKAFLVSAAYIIMSCWPSSFAAFNSVTVCLHCQVLLACKIPSALVYRNMQIQTVSPAFPAIS